VSRLLKWIEGLALALGGPGLFLLSFLDSSFLSFPEVTDILIVVLVTKHPERFLWYTALPTLGSILGCYVLYALAYRGGEAFMRKRMKERHVERAFAVFRKYGLFAVSIPSILPPPVPFKIFVLAAGAARVKPLDFLVAVTIGRGVRYFGEGLLALWYGQWALDLLNEHGRAVSLSLAGIIALLGFAYIWWTRRRGDVDATAGSSV
jgi:membrane protein YqaA with SNARE-associated domain